MEITMTFALFAMTGDTFKTDIKEMSIVASGSEINRLSLSQCH